jgi:methylmalonyl-CoA mutase C-terminal domain/subunit
VADAPERRIRILIAKPGLDGHDRGAKFIARALQEAGMEVIYTGIRQTPEAIVNAAVQEDVDAIGLSILSGAHHELFPEIMERLRAAGGGDILVFAGGVIPDADVPFCKQIGVQAVFGPGTSVDEAVRFVRDNVRKG